MGWGGLRHILKSANTSTAAASRRLLMSKDDHCTLRSLQDRTGTPSTHIFSESSRRDLSIKVWVGGSPRRSQRAATSRSVTDPSARIPRVVSASRRKPWSIQQRNGVCSNKQTDPIRSEGRFCTPWTGTMQNRIGCSPVRTSRHSALVPSDDGLNSTVFHINDQLMTRFKTQLIN